MTADAKPGLSGFWKAITAAHVYAASGVQDETIDAIITGGLSDLLGGGAPPPIGGRPEIDWPYDDPELSEEQKRRAEIEVEEADGTHLHTPEVSPEWRYSVDEPPADSGGGWWRPWSPGSGPGLWFRKARCCVEKFEYPERFAFLPESGGNALGGRVGFEFGMMGEYSDKPDCYCSCCAFRQFVDSSVSMRWLASSVWYSRHRGGYREDCAGSGGNSDCYPSKWNDDENSSFKQADAEGNLTRCVWRNHDEPGVIAIPGLFYAMDYKFMGRIYDRCNNDAIVRTEMFRVLRVGWVMADGTVEDSASGMMRTNADGSAIRTP